ncbi:subunit of TIM23 translocase complex [Ophidiomyces ophidiicola]|uniref:Subunit of TIM23 translocase complex n=1 Tax=Ophidiomyces ophidiicola TaxID=1387563 RepID=A0ACB8V1Z5_9EURO|nr:subunit of TIM23 translocase complex [Ophidiomyces ophidiicola]KAI1917368.1 subunit of TIM23 translocase complex [Ophidiomyces ophidiicola]KAI1924405.1 subunit of TIM23 translocase complex [Ophidiomyces ophidiicola]KAI1929306.1 subunit of TIM23 translocase complex [Ophidiomyces ophidiicola]KAI1942223.1 subunit of TIM23 translocase complex [Ophidiomyces ophidiicola]KAI1955355.1 subunit of TIM23 translocase complex [Ophidiomyces ophidiicola]
MPPVAAPSGGGMRGPSTVDKLKMGAMMGGSVGLIMGFIIGTVSIFQYGAGPNGIMRTLGKYMAGSAATFGGKSKLVFKFQVLRKLDKRQQEVAALEFLWHFRQPPPLGIYDFSKFSENGVLDFRDVVKFFIASFSRSRTLSLNNGLQFINASRTYIIKHRILVPRQSILSSGKCMLPDISIYDSIIERSVSVFQHFGDPRLERFQCVRIYLKKKVAESLGQAEDDYMQEYQMDQLLLIEKPFDYGMPRIIAFLPISLGAKGQLD